jgi:hypothetical protein
MLVTDRDFQRYLRAKRTVDDRALDETLLERLRTELVARARDRDGPIRILEVGAGIGTMIQRFVDRDLFPAGDIEYVAVDVDDANVRTMRRRIPEWAATRGFDVGDGQTIVVSGADRTLSIEPVEAEATAFVAGDPREWDLLIGAALLDVLGLDRVPTLLSGLGPEGLCYFPITFDGATRFLPAESADRAVERYYHRHMDAKPGGDSRAGDHAFELLHARSDATTLDVAGSDWIVRPDGGTYPADEAYFLSYILDTVEAAVGELDRDDDLSDAVLEDWIARRRGQLAAGDLAYHTHQLDLLARVD